MIDTIVSSGGVVEPPVGYLSKAAEFTSAVVNDLKNRGVLTGSIGPDAKILKLRPPMIFSKADADLCIEVLEKTFSSV